MKQKSLFFSGNSNRDQTEKRVYASSSRGGQISSKGCVVVHIYFGIPGAKLMENIIEKIMTMLVSGFNHK